ncbi:P-loop containing nucleoside triphosphate hydrolase protein [Pavlovales sp. CCMP2436]|nr:P-loop containing nucleoside triphosphate hydrolase protein [Pavlovales sp. CCMP2436]
MSGTCAPGVRHASLLLLSQTPTQGMNGMHAERDRMRAESDQLVQENAELRKALRERTPAPPSRQAASHSASGLARHSADEAPTQTPTQAPTQKKQKIAPFCDTGLEAAFDDFENAEVQPPSATGLPCGLMRFCCPEGRPSPSPAPHPAQASSGTIMKIELLNFMNHAHLTVDLKPGVNFVFGKNGSGKSALLAGCMVALGSTAGAVKAGTKLSNYIQSGKNVATVTIWLYNGGADRYMPDEFGQQILIERVIDLKTNPHSAKAVDGSVIKSKTTEISEICAFFSINVANPCTILTQEKARLYLTSTKDSDRYELFMAVMCLDLTRDNILGMVDDIERMRSEIRRFGEDQDKLKGAVAAKKAEWEQGTELARAEGKIALLECKLKFVQAAAAQAELNAARATVDEHTASYDLVGPLERFRDAAAKAEAAHAEAVVRTSSVDNQVYDIIEQIKVHKGDRAAAEKARVSAKSKSEQAESRALKQREDAKALLARAEQQQLTFGKQQLDAELKRNAHRSALKEKQAQVTEGLTKLESAEEQLFSDHSTSHQRVVDDHKQEENLAQELGALQDQHKALSQASGPGQRLALLDSTKPLTKWVQLIDTNAHRFSAKPIGPLGLQVSITDAKFQLAIEGCLGNLLTSFIVTSHDDRKEFEKLLTQACLSFPDIITKQFEDHELPIPDSALPDRSRFRLMLDAVKFSHPMAQHAAVDRARIEAQVLVESEPEGAAIIFAPGSTRNVAKVWLANCYSMHKRGRTEATDRPPKGSGKKRTGVDTRTELLQITTEIDEKKAALAEQKRYSAALNSSAANYERAAKDFKSKRAQLQDEDHELQTQLDRLNQEGGQEEHSVQLAQDEANDKNEQADRLLQQAKVLRAEMREAEVKVAAFTQRISDLEAESTEIFNRNGANHEEVDELYKAAKKSKLELDSNSKALGDFERARDDAMAAASALEGAAHLTQQAALAGLAAGEEQPDIRRLTEGAICHQLKRKRQRIKDLQAEGGGDSEPITANDISALETSYTQLYEKLQSLKLQEENVRVGMTALEDAHKRRVKQWTLDRKNYGEIASDVFDFEMNVRGLSGSLEFDHSLEDSQTITKSTLKLYVQPDSQGASSNRTQDVATLSGGERSFTTMAFQVAMWQMASAPFRCMDEFDVFMDDVYRQKAIDLLLKMCDNQASNQFLFLTPQDMSSMLDADTLNRHIQKLPKRHIFKMPDPRVN